LLFGKLALLHSGPPFFTKFYHWFWTSFPVLEHPDYSRDPKDDYLVAYGVVNEADYVITGDADLLVLGHIGRLQIVNPSDFVSLLKEYELIA
jgi:predicted nucleic acid-binding protein